MQDIDFFSFSLEGYFDSFGKMCKSASTGTMTYFHKVTKKGENMKDWTGTQSFVCRVLYKVNYRSQPNKIPYMITLEGLLTCLFQEMVIKGEIMKDQIRTKSWFI